MKTKLFIQFLMLAAVLFLESCVGTVKDADPITTKASASQDSTVQNFLGVNSVKAVADSKVEVYFAPISGDSDQIAYVIHYGGQVNSVYVQASSLRPDYRGLMKYTIAGLQADTQYDFNVQARNIKTGAESTNNASKTARTFSNATAVFDGIMQVRNLAGADGLNGIEVFWNEALALGGAISKKEIDPIEYRVTVINAAALNPGNMNDLAFSEPMRKVFSISASKRSAVINGLNPGQKYYVQVRCIHYGSSQNSSDPQYLVEQNTNYLEISTYTDDLANVNFDNSSFTSTFPPGAGGLYSINTQWKIPVGNFDHYRIYYVPHKDGGTNLLNFLNTETLKTFCFGPETKDPSVSCEYVESKNAAYALTGLAPYNQYDMILAICITADCSKSKRILSNLRLHTTTPGVAHFTGISSTAAASNLEEINKLFLSFTPPDFSTGNISGLLVDYYGSDPTNDSPKTLNDSDISNDSALSVDDFDFLANTTLSISGVDPSSILPYCFLVYPFTYNPDGTKTTYKTGLTPKCQAPAITGPTAIDFPGFSNKVCDTTNKEAILTWQKPASGVFQQYEFYYIQTSGAFTFGAAIADINQASYHKVILNSTQTSFHLTDMQPGKTYKFGVLTYFSSMYGTVRSEFNTQTSTCAF